MVSQESQLIIVRSSAFIQILTPTAIKGQYCTFASVARGVCV